MGYREILKTSLEEKQKINHRYSMRTFAKKIGLEASTLSQILRGRRELPVADVQKVISRLELSPEMQKEFLDSMDTKSVQGRYYENYLATPAPLETQSRDEQVRNFLEDPFYSAILVLMDTVGFQTDPKWMADRLDRPVERTAKAWKDLQNLGLVVFEKDHFVKKYVDLKTSDEVQNKSLKIAHSSELELAREALETIDLTARDFTSLTVAVDIQQLKQAKILIRSFLKQMEDLLENKKSSEVYQLNVQLFPLTKTASSKEPS